MQHSTVTDGDRFGRPPSWHEGADRAAGRHRASGTPRRRWPLVAVAVAVVVCALAIGGWLAFTPTHRSAPQAAEPIAVDCPPDAAAWIRANLPSSSRLLTDGITPPGGYPTSTLAGAEDWRDFDYLLTTHTGTSSADSVVTPVLQSSLGVAVFDWLQVRRIVATDAGDPPPSRDADADARLRAGSDLLSNPRILVSPNARPILSRGDLDLRAAAVLSGLAGQLDVTLQEIVSDPAEARAGVPARTVTIYAADPVRAVRAVGAFDAALKPDQVNVGEYGAVHLRWQLSYTPLPAVK